MDGGRSVSVAPRSAGPGRGWTGEGRHRGCGSKRKHGNEQNGRRQNRSGGEGLKATRGESM